MGKGGGSRIGQDPKNISLCDVYLATESKPGVKTHECCDMSKCPVQAGMSTMLADINDRVQKAVQSELKQTTIADLLTGYLGK